MGYDSLKANTTGSENVAIGVNALLSNTTAAENTAIGVNAMYANTTGGDNVALGHNALDANTTASNNTAVGKAALTANTTGTDNVGLGAETLLGNVTGSANTALGRGALASNSTADNNTALGRSALLNSTTGAVNVAVGKSAGDTITTGGGCVILGALADSSTVGGNYVNVLGYAVTGDAGYTTLGESGSDIRAAHGNVTWATVSDQRYKKDIVDSTAGLSFINALQPRTFKYKTLGELPETFRAYKADSTEVFKNSDTNHGFIAQEIKAAIDADSSIADGFKLWDDREDGSQEVAEAALIPILVKAIQELTARITTLEG